MIQSNPVDWTGLDCWYYYSVVLIQSESTGVQWIPVDSDWTLKSGLESRGSPVDWAIYQPVWPGKSPVDSTGVHMDYVGEGKVLLEYPGIRVKCPLKSPRYSYENHNEISEVLSVPHMFWSALIRIRNPPSPAILAGKQLSNGPTQSYSALISTDQNSILHKYYSCYYINNKKEVHEQGLNHSLQRCHMTKYWQYYH